MIYDNVTALCAVDQTDWLLLRREATTWIDIFKPCPQYAVDLSI